MRDVENDVLDNFLLGLILGSSAQDGNNNS